MSDRDREEPYEQTVRHARKMLDPEDPPRSLFLGVTYANGSDFVYRHSAAAEKPAVDLAEVLATHLSAAASVCGEDVETMADIAVRVAETQETVGGNVSDE